MNAPRFAENTVVDPSKSKGELEAVLRRNGATQTVFATDDAARRMVVAFTVEGRQIRMAFPFLVADDILDAWGKSYFKGEKLPPGCPELPHLYGRMPTEKRRAKALADGLQLERSRWRQILLVIKAKLEVVAMGLSTAEREFLADLVLPSGESVHQVLAPRIDEAYKLGRMQSSALLLGAGGGA
jgi:hypothetical protein